MRPGSWTNCGSHESEMHMKQTLDPSLCRLRAAAFLCGVMLMGSTSSAALIRADDVSVIGNESGGTFVTGSLDVFMELDDPMTTSGFQIQLTLPPQIKVYFESVDAPVDHDPALPAELFTTQVDPPSMLGTPPAVRTIKATFTPEEIEDGAGLARIHFRVEPDSFGFYPVTVVTMAADPFFGTTMTDEAFGRVDVVTANGMIRVVPEPGMIGVFTCFASRRRR